MQKTKILILLGGLLVLVASFSLFAGAEAASKQTVTFDASTPITFNMKKNYNAKKIPPGFDKKKNVETGKKLGINVMTAQSEDSTFNEKLRSPLNKDSITVNQELRNDGDYLIGNGGSIELSIEGKKHNLPILSSLVSHFN
ncbi:hypothetical protein M1D70_15210 [Paenibacillus sp. AK002]